MKSKESLNAIKEKVKALNSKLAELTEEELAQVTGGNVMQKISDLAKQSFQLEEGCGDDAKNYLEKMGHFYGKIIP